MQGVWSHEPDLFLGVVLIDWRVSASEFVSVSVSGFSTYPMHDMPGMQHVVYMLEYNCNITCKGPQECYASHDDKQ